ncbi:MAG: DUF6713 family protein [Bacteroidota bacterium]
MISDVVFFTAVSFILLHEMDAVKYHEWNLLPILNKMDDEKGYWWFTVLHLPLYVGMFVGVKAVILNQGLLFAQLLDGFLIIHFFLHFFLRKHSKYRFHNPLSWTLIIGAAVFGLAHLVMIMG